MNQKLEQLKLNQNILADKMKLLKMEMEENNRLMDVIIREMDNPKTNKQQLNG